MTKSEFVGLIEDIEGLWGKQTSWSNTDRLYQEFAVMSARVVATAIQAAFRKGRQFAPSPSELYAIAHPLHPGGDWDHAAVAALAPARADIIAGQIPEGM